MSNPRDTGHYKRKWTYIYSIKGLPKGLPLDRNIIKQDKVKLLTIRTWNLTRNIITEREREIKLESRESLTITDQYQTSISTWISINSLSFNTNQHRYLWMHFGFIFHSRSINMIQNTKLTHNEKIFLLTQLCSVWNRIYFF